jgi:FkbM family methyltransferase
LLPDGLVARLPAGEQVRLSAEHRHLGWNRYEYDAFRADITPGDVVLDLGANIGAYSVLFARWTGDAGHVFAFEPAPESRRTLIDVLQTNGVSHRVSVLAAAVGSSCGRAPFLANGSDGANRITNGDRAGSVDVETTTIDAFCERMRIVPGFMKVDVEGAELAVLRGARRTIASAKNLKLYVEMHPRLWPEYGVTQADIEEELRLQKLRAERLDGSADLWNLEGVCLRLVRCAS